MLRDRDFIMTYNLLSKIGEQERLSVNIIYPARSSTSYNRSTRVANYQRACPIMSVSVHVGMGVRHTFPWITNHVPQKDGVAESSAGYGVSVL